MNNLPPRGSPPAKQRRLGITRVELLVVIFLILVVGGLVATFILRGRGQSAQVVCMENLRILGVAIYARNDIKLGKVEVRESMFAGTRASLPAARISEGYATWAVQLAPYLPRADSLSRWDVGLPFTQQSAEARNSVISVFFCPARSRPNYVFAQEEAGVMMGGAVGDYACASGDGDPNFPWTGPKANGAIVEGQVLQQEGIRIQRWESRVLMSDLAGDNDGPGRGLAYTILIGEKHVPRAELGHLEAGDGSLYDGRHPSCYARVGGPGFGLATGPDAPFNYNFGSYHAGMCNFLYADVNVQRMNVDVSPNVLGGRIRRGR